MNAPISARTAHRRLSTHARACSESWHQATDSVNPNPKSTLNRTGRHEVTYRATTVVDIRQLALAAPRPARSGLDLRQVWRSDWIPLAVSLGNFRVLGTIARSCPLSGVRITIAEIVKTELRLARAEGIGEHGDVCRQCGGCIYVCPACQLRCTYAEPEKAICGGCANLAPPCVEKKHSENMLCYMDPCVACEIRDSQ